MTRIFGLLRFIFACARYVGQGSRLYRAWLGVLVVFLIPGVVAWLYQFEHGLVVTGMSDQVSWGAYIANFTYLVGIAAAAVMLVIPAYVFHNHAAQRVVLIGEALAVAACVMALLFVAADLGRPERFWHLIPVWGQMNWPRSMMSWDVVVLNGYLAINLLLPLYLLYRIYRGRLEHPPWFEWAIGLAILWAISLHTVTAFLFSSNVGREFWHSALLGPRFLASAFSAGPAFILLTFAVIDRITPFHVPGEVMRLLSLIVAGALQVNLFMLFAEGFTELYAPTESSVSFQYLLLGHQEHSNLVPWMAAALSMELVAVTILTLAPLRNHKGLMFLAAGLCAIGVWIEKGMGLIVPGFVPTPLGEFLEYGPTLVELAISFSIWAFGALVFSVLVRPILGIEEGALREQPQGEPS